MSTPYDGNTVDVRIRSDVDPIPGADLDLIQPIPGCAVGTQTYFTTAQVPSTPGSILATIPDGDTAGQVIDKWNWQLPANQDETCPTGLDSKLINNLFLRILIKHFAEVDEDGELINVTNPNLVDLKFTGDPSTSKIRIALNTVYDFASSLTMPALIIKRGGIKSARIGIGDSVNFQESSDGETQSVEYVRTITGSHSILVISALDGEVEELATEVFDLLTRLSPAIRAVYPFFDFQIEEMSEVQLADEGGNKFVVGINVSYAYEHGWLTCYGDKGLTPYKGDAAIHANLLGSVGIPVTLT
jgi:hypothetical protein